MSIKRSLFRLSFDYKSSSDSAIGLQVASDVNHFLSLILSSSPYTRRRNLPQCISVVYHAGIYCRKFVEEHLSVNNVIYNVFVVNAVYTRPPAFVRL